MYQKEKRRRLLRQIKFNVIENGTFYFVFPKENIKFFYFKCKGEKSVCKSKEKLLLGPRKEEHSLLDHLRDLELPNLQNTNKEQSLIRRFTKFQLHIYFS